MIFQSTGDFLLFRFYHHDKENQKEHTMSRNIFPVALNAVALGYGRGRDYIEYA
jgi:hypothetical protein